MIENLIAILLPVALFVYFWLIGFSTQCVLGSKKNVLQNTLISPAIGIAITLLPVFLLSRAALPVKQFSFILSTSLFVLSILILIKQKPVIPFSRLLSFGGILIIAYFLTGRPLLYFGFNWLSYANDDMTNYCLAALRLLNYGYFDLPELKSILAGKDYSQYSWFWLVPGMVRSASELLLAWLSALTHRNPSQIFMPLLLSFHLTLISSIGAMVLGSKQFRKIALVTCLFVACSALTTLGAEYQLIAQVLGLSLFIGCGTLLQRLFYTNIKYRFNRNAILLAILVSSLLLAYPELFPILGLAFIIYSIIAFFKGWRPSKLFFLLLVVSLVESLFLLNSYWLNVISFLHVQMTEGVNGLKGDLFPYFLIPSGFADLWGLQTLATGFKEPFSSLSILLGMFFSVLTFWLSIKQISKQFFPAVITLTMVLLVIFLCWQKGQQSGFSLFKIAMYIQPFLFSVLAAGLIGWKVKTRIKLTAITFIATMGLGIQFSYVLASYGDIGQPFSELARASLTHFPSELSELTKKLPNQGIVISDTTNALTAKLQALYFADKNIEFPSSNIFFLPFAGRELFKRLSPETYKFALNLSNNLLNNTKKKAFTFLNSNNILLTNHFYKLNSNSNGNTLILAETPLRSIFNRIELAKETNRNYLISPSADISNHLIFVNSTLGQNYYFGHSKHISLHALQKDPFYPQSSFTRIGRYLLFQIINPSQQHRLVLDFTTTPNRHNQHRLPSAMVIGTKSYLLPLVGRGSARVFSPIFNHRTINETPYFMLDMGIDPSDIPRPRKGLMRLYGLDVPVGYQIFVGYARNISLISEEEYQQLTPPNNLKNFPNDLQNHNLAYSGIYEDGWVSEDATVTLSKGGETSLTIQGSFPSELNPKHESLYMSVSINNEEMTIKKISSGAFQFLVSLPKENERPVVHLHFNRTFSLPNGDDRFVSVKLNFIGFKTQEIGRQYKQPSFINNFAFAFKNKKLEYSGLYEDGWVSKEAYLKLAHPQGASTLVLNGFLPKQKNNIPMKVEIYADRKKIEEVAIKPGPIKLAMTIPESTLVKNILLKFNHDFICDKKDKRLVSLKLHALGFK